MNMKPTRTLDGAERLSGSNYLGLTKARSAVAARPDRSSMVVDSTIRSFEREMKTEYSEADRALTSKLDNYAVLFESSPIGFVKATCTGIIRAVNAAGAQLLGHAQSVVLRQSLLNFIVAGDRSTFLALLLRVTEGHATDTCEVKIRREGAGLFPLKLNVMPWSEDDASVLVALERSAPQRSAEETQRANEALRTLDRRKDE
jgi:PAS domain S-box-containing protein